MMSSPTISSVIQDDRTSHDTAQTIRSLQQELQQARETTEIYQALLDKFVQELRHPISNINMAIQILKQQADRAEDNRGYLGILEAECLRGTSLLNEITHMQELLPIAKATVLKKIQTMG
jgi:two-component system, OmpR family, alkaline phosphatase synthesis response regulator PhoP